MRKAGTWFDWIRNLLVAFLLICLGIVLGFRYANEGHLLGWKISPLDNLLQAEDSPLSRLVGSSSQAKEEVSLDTFWEVWSLLDNYYLDQGKLNDTDMLNGAIRGMVAGLGDPYTMYLAPADNKETSEDLAGSFYGVGIELGYVEQTLAVVAPLEGGPGAKAGLQAGDLILHVKDESKGLDQDTIGWSLTQAVQNIRGEKGVPVILTIFREGMNEPQDYSIVRDEIIVETVEVDFLAHNDKELAHLKINRFGERTSKEWDLAVTQILARKKNLAGIILDLRNNPGGYFETSIEIASDFVNKGVVVSQQGQLTTRNYDSSGRSRLVGIPVVILVNKGSASAAEIVAGALRDDVGARLVGEQTFGKGTVQDRVELSNGGGLHITVGRWLTPSGNWIHDNGLNVDVEVAQDYDTEADEILERALTLF